MVPARPFFIGRPGWVRSRAWIWLFSSMDRTTRRRIDVEADDVAQLVDEFRIGGELELTDAVGLKSVGAPDALHRTDADADRLRHGGAGPVGRLAGRGLHRQSDDAFGDRGIELRNPRAPRLVAQKALEAFRRETLLPAPHASLGLAGLAHDRVRAGAFGAQQHDPRPPDVLLRSVAIFDQILKPPPVGESDREGNAGSHAPDSHAASRPGILSRIQMLDLIH